MEVWVEVVVFQLVDLFAWLIVIVQLVVASFMIALIDELGGLHSGQGLGLLALFGALLRLAQLI
jgi:hypothetical protein